MLGADLELVDKRQQKANNNISSNKKGTAREVRETTQAEQGEEQAV